MTFSTSTSPRPLFQNLSKKQLRLISQLATELEEPAGTVLIHEGKAGHEFIVVIEGEIEVRHGGPRDR